MKISVCKICKEPLWSFICSDCIAGDMRASLPAVAKEEFDKFYAQFCHSFLSPEDISFDACLHCHADRESPVCTYCFVNEMRSWLRNAFGKDMAGFIFHFENKGFSAFFVNRRWIPITRLMCDQRLEGICENCGEYEENLACHDGKWACSDCIESEVGI